MKPAEISALHAQVFSGFINEHLPIECGDHCSASDSCFDRFLLLDTGVVTPWEYNPLEPDPDFWAVWPECPRHFGGELYYIDQGEAPLVECCRWAVERGLHRRGTLSARGSYLLREWTRIKDLPAALHQKIFNDKMDDIQKNRGK